MTSVATSSLRLSEPVAEMGRGMRGQGIEQFLVSHKIASCVYVVETLQATPSVMGFTVSSTTTSSWCTSSDKDPVSIITFFAWPGNIFFYRDDHTVWKTPSRGKSKSTISGSGAEGGRNIRSVIWSRKTSSFGGIPTMVAGYTDLFTSLCR